PVHPGGVRHQGGVRAPRGAGGAGIYRPALRGAHRAADSGRHGNRTGGSGGEPRRPALADLPPCGIADPAPRPAHRLCPGLRPGGGGVRLGDLHRRQYSLCLGDHPVDDHHPAGAIRLHRCHRHRRGDAGGVLRPAVGDKRPAGLGRQAHREEPLMAGAATALLRGARDLGPHARVRGTRFERTIATRESTWIKWTILGVSLTFFTVFIFLPLVAVFVEALRKGLEVYWKALVEPDALAAVKLTLIAAAISVPLNLVFGAAAAWTIAKFEIRGKQLLTTLIDLRLSISPVIVGLLYVLVFGANGWFGAGRIEHDIKIIFAVPGIVLATIFVTFPFVARE